MFSSQPLSVFGTKFVAPEADRFVTDCDTSFSQQVFDIPVAEVEAIIGPNCVLDDFRWESITLIYEF